MIDFITVSHTPGMAQRLSNSLEAALHNQIPYQLTVIDGNKYDLFTGYNAGAARTSSPILAFIHHDVVLLSNHLCFRPVLKILEQPNCGFVVSLVEPHLAPMASGPARNSAASRRPTYVVDASERPRKIRLICAGWRTARPDFRRWSPCLGRWLRSMVC